MHIHKLLTVLLLVINSPCLCASEQTAGQSPSSAAQQPGEQNRARNDPNQLPVHYETVVVTATKIETNVFDLPVSVHSVSKDRIDAIPFNNPNLGEIVRDLPGVSVGHGNRNIPPWIHLRGTGYFIGRTLYMVDELPLAEPMVSIAAHPNNLSSVEVLLGPSSSLYGANASGGVVNARSLSARQRSGATLGLGYATFGTWRPQLSLGKTLGNWDFYSSYNLDKSNGYKNTDLETGLYLMNNGYPSYLNYVAIEDQHYRNHFGYQRIGYRNPNSGVGFSAGAHVLGEDSYGGRQNAYSWSTRLIGTGSFFAPVSTIGLFKARFGYQSRASDSQNVRGVVNVPNSAIAGRFVFAPAGAANSWVYDPTVTQRPHATYTRLPLDFQMDFKNLRGNQLTAGYTELIDQSRSFTFNAAGTATLAQTKFGVNSRAIYIQDQYRFLNQRAALILGFRQDFWKYHDVYDTGSTNRTPPDVSKSARTYRGGFRYRLNESWGLRASAGTAFWPGAAVWFFQNLSTGNIWREANPNLKPERTQMLDGGVDYVSPGGKTRATAAYYWGRIRDAMSYVYAQHPTLPGVQIIRTSNSDEVALKGFELSLHQDLGRGLGAFANHTLNRSRITKSAKNKGNQLRNAPDYVGSFGLRYLLTRLNLGAAFTGRYSDTRFYDDENTKLRYFHMREYLTLSLKAWKDIPIRRNRLSLSLGIDNLTNSKYDGEFIYNAPGRFVEVRATYHFGI